MKSRGRSTIRPRFRAEIIIACEAWKTEPGLPLRLKKAVSKALEMTGQAAGRLTILLTDDEALRALNRQFRGRDKATNVLSFAAADPGPGHLGDIAIANGVAVREAKAEGKSVHDHVTHLAVHGGLHLLGHDHKTARDAAVMERLEIAILAQLGIADPYVARTAA